MEGPATAIVVEVEAVEVDVFAMSVAAADPTVEFVAAETATEQHLKKHPKMTPATDHFAAAA